VFFVAFVGVLCAIGLALWTALGVLVFAHPRFALSIVGAVLGVAAVVTLFSNGGK
jgi:hypothetical protein